MFWSEMNAALNVIKREQLCCLNVLNFRMTSVLHRTVIPESFTFLVLIEKLIFFLFALFYWSWRAENRVLQALFFYIITSFPDTKRTSTKNDNVSIVAMVLSKRLYPTWFPEVTRRQQQGNKDKSAIHVN